MNKKLAIPIIIGLVLLFSGCIETVSNGTHSAQITAVQLDGLLFKTYTVYVKSDVSSSQEESYCIDESHLDIVPSLIQASKDRRKVVITYRDEFIVAPWRCQTSSGRIIGLSGE